MCRRRAATTGSADRRSTRGSTATRSTARTGCGTGPAVLTAVLVSPTNGAEFGSRFHYHVLDAGVAHVRIKPATPRLNGRVERSHRIDAEEFYRMLNGIVIDDTALFNDKLKEWENFYNFNRPHGALGGQTPYERHRQKTQTQP